MKEARKNHALPIDDRVFERLIPAMVGRPDLMAGRTSLTLAEGMTGMTENVFLDIKNKSKTITAEIEVPEDRTLPTRLGPVRIKVGKTDDWIALDEGSWFYMPSLYPAASFSQAMEVLQTQDVLIKEIPEVAEVLGKIGRVESPLDPAPISMIETVINYKSKYIVDKSGQRMTFKFDEDKTCGAVDLRRAFMQVWTLDRNDYGKNGEFVGLDVKAMRTQPAEVATQHLSNSREIFLALLDVVRRLDSVKIDELIGMRNYEALEMEIMRALMGRS